MRNFAPESLAIPRTSRPGSGWRVQGEAFEGQPLSRQVGRHLRPRDGNGDSVGLDLRLVVMNSHGSPRALVIPPNGARNLNRIFAGRWKS